MSEITHSEFSDVYRTGATNSSHFTCLLQPEWRFYKSSNGWVFAFQVMGEVVLIGMEPIHSQARLDGVLEAWREFQNFLPSSFYAFVAINHSFASLLAEQGFEILPIGKEPWIRPESWSPHGNSTKGLRSARNQAIAAGVVVEEWPLNEIPQDPQKRNAISSLLDQWRRSSLFHIDGFVMATDPFFQFPGRRCFVARSAARIEAYLIATPVPGIQAYFLEDTIKRNDAARGTGELITLSAIEALKADSSKISLGACSSSRLQSPHGVPRLTRAFFWTASQLLRTFYNSQGIELFRKRFKPTDWEPIYIAAVSTAKDRRARRRLWPKVGASLVKAFKLRIMLSDAVLRALTLPVRNYPVTVFMTLASFACFATINRFGKLPEEALNRWGILAESSLSEWLPRSIMSDFLYLDPIHFLTCVTALAFALAWLERTHRRSTVLLLVGGSILLEDLVNYAVLIKPYDFFHPAIFENLVRYKEVGGSLVLAVVLGFQICRFRKFREYLYSVLTLSIMISVMLISAKTHIGSRFDRAVIDMSHILFLQIGFLLGKLEFELHRRAHEKASRGKPPRPKSGSRV